MTINLFDKSNVSERLMKLVDDCDISSSDEISFTSGEKFIDKLIRRNQIYFNVLLFEA